MAATQLIVKKKMPPSASSLEKAVFFSSTCRTLLYIQLMNAFDLCALRCQRDRRRSLNTQGHRTRVNWAHSSTSTKVGVSY